MTLTLDDKIELGRVRRELPPPATRRYLRKEAGLSQQDLADELGVSRVTLTRWENGERSPGSEHLAGYAGLLERLRRELVGP